MNFGYTVFLKDFMSQGFVKVAQNANTTYSKIAKKQDIFQRKLFQGSRNLNTLNQKLDNLRSEQGTAVTIRKLRKINGEIRKTHKQITKLENLPPNSFLDRLRQGGGLLTGLRGQAVALFSVVTLFNGAKGFANLGLGLEQTRVKFTTLTGSAQIANQTINSINQLANKTPFENGDLLKGAERLLNFGVANQKVLPTLKLIGAVAGGNKQRFDSLSLAYAQVQSAGRLMGQDLLQMINAGFNPLQIISEKTGKSMAQLKTDMSNGAISAKDVEQAFIVATSTGGRFHGMLEKMSQTGLGKLSTFLGNLKTNLAVSSEKFIVPFIGKIADFGNQFLQSFDKVQTAIRQVFNALSPVFNAIGSVLSAFFGFSDTINTATQITNGLVWVLNSISGVLRVVANGVATVLNWLKPMVSVLKILLIIYGAVKIAQILWNIAMIANPIGLIVGGIVLLIGVLVTAYQRVGWFRGAILATWEAIKGFGSAIKNYVIARLKELLSGVVGVASALWDLMNGRWQEAFKKGKNALDNLLGFQSKSDLINNVKKIGDKAGASYAKGVQQAAENKLKGFTNPLKKITDGVPDASGGTNGDFNTSATSNAFSSGINSITGGGKKQTNINVSFGKLVENLIIKSQTLEQGTDEIEDRLKEMLLRVLNSTNQLQVSNG